jgi:hypothetical protein
LPGVAAGAFGFLIFNHAFDGPNFYGASSLPIKSLNMIAPGIALPSSLAGNFLSLQT